ncbi:UNVERIFIED_CONTAM: Actin-related protein 8 [Sesamum radiatum]|uniref:Actin-related protein 8 n=1 Tax=Sesamum radiatum TaxID=300843 RepID=A0AAW2T5Q1_SESRA
MLKWSRGVARGAAGKCLAWISKRIYRLGDGEMAEALPAREVVLLAIRKDCPLFGPSDHFPAKIWSEFDFLEGEMVWVSVVSRSGSSSGSAHMSNPNPLSDHDRFLQMMYIQTSSTGEFDRIPIDIFMQILKILGPRESARIRAVCKAWKFLVSDNRLWIYFLQNQPEPWDSVFFAETHLRSGYPLQVFPSQMHDLSFMHIYGQREEVPGALIIDGGSGYCKYGWSKYSSPSGRSATFLEFGNIESPMPSRLRHFFSTICNRMQVKTSTQPIVVSIPLCHYDSTESAKSSRRQLKDAIYSTLFDMNVPAVCAINQATLALFAARRTSGVVVNVGFHQTSVVPILHGKVMHKVGVEVVGMGALKLTGFLRDRMQQNNIHFDSLYTVRTLKELSTFPRSWCMTRKQFRHWSKRKLIW